MIDREKYTNHSGGAYGADTYGCIIGLGLGFSNHNHYTSYDNPRVSKKLRDKGIKPFVLDEFCMKQNRYRLYKLIGKEYEDNLTGNLQSRNYFQVVNSDAIYCFADIKSANTISGGTNTALQLAISMCVDAYVYDLGTLGWFKYNEVSEELEPCRDPVLTSEYAIIGSRNIEDYHVKDRKTGVWGSRKTYVGKEKEAKVVEVMTKLYMDTIEKAVL